MNKNERFNYLLKQFLSGETSVEEHDEFFNTLATAEFDKVLDQYIEKDLKYGFENNHADLPPHIAEEIVRNIYKSEKDNTRILPMKRPFYSSWRWVAAASVFIIALSAFFYYLNHIPEDKNGQGQFAHSSSAKNLVQKNNTGKPITISLSDGSKVTLEANSTLHYLKDFKGASREVLLEGSGFFEVIKNPESAFVVYYGEIITKVLGTSFSIHKNEKTGNPEVSVKSGRVQVSENSELRKNHSTRSSVIVTPNQKAIYLIKEGVLETTLVDAPEPVLENNIHLKDSKQLFVYDQEKLENIFKQFEKIYGIEIAVENTNLNNCLFTGDVSNQDLFTKLKIICMTTNSDYEVNGTKILIKGKGCQ